MNAVVVFTLFSNFLIGVISSPEPTERSQKSLPKKVHETYEVLDVTTSCSNSKYGITLRLNRPFSGVLYAKGYPMTKAEKPEKRCYVFGDGNENVSIFLKPYGCGVRLLPLDDTKLSYTVTLVLQTDKFLQQITNFEISTSCTISATELGQTRRGGRKLEDNKNTMKTWMEIKSATGLSTVSVGEPVKVFVKTFLPAHLEPRVVGCVAYDGLRESSESLSDANGCSLDETLMPTMEDFNNSAPASEMEWEAPPLGEDFGTKDSTNSILRVIGTSFSAFKFPDTANLHIKCTLLVCRFQCPMPSCSKPRRKGRESQGSVVLEKLDVFNSIKVRAPGIDNGVQDTKKDLRKGSESAFCLPTSRVAFTFAALGGVFLFAVITAFCALLRSNRRKSMHNYSSGQIIMVQRGKAPFSPQKRCMLSPRSSFA